MDTTDVEGPAHRIRQRRKKKGKEESKGDGIRLEDSLALAQDGGRRECSGTDGGHVPLPGASEQFHSSESDLSSDDEGVCDSDELYGSEELSDIEESCSEGEFSEMEDNSEDEENDDAGDRKGLKKHTCAECGFRASKPALLTQHMRSHSDENGNPSCLDAVIQALQHRITFRTPQLSALGQISTGVGDPPGSPGSAVLRFLYMNSSP